MYSDAIRKALKIKGYKWAPKPVLWIRPSNLTQGWGSMKELIKDLEAEGYYIHRVMCEDITLEDFGTYSKFPPWNKPKWHPDLTNAINSGKKAILFFDRIEYVEDPEIAERIFSLAFERVANTWSIPNHCRVLLGYCGDSFKVRKGLKKEMKIVKEN